MRWEDLSISEKDSIISLYVLDGIDDLELIKKRYSKGHMFFTGGSKTNNPLDEALDRVELRAIRRATTPLVVPVPTVSIPTIRPGDYANMLGPDNYTFNSDVEAQLESRRIAAQNAMIEALYKANTVPVRVSTAGGGITTVRVPKDWGYTEGKLVVDPRATAIALEELPERYADPVNNALNWGIFTALTGVAAASNGAFSNTINSVTDFTKALGNSGTITHKVVKPLLAGTIGLKTLNLGSELLTGQTYDQHVSNYLQSLGLSQQTSDLLAPFGNVGGWYSAGRYLGPYIGFGSQSPLDESITALVNKYHKSITPHFNFKNIKLYIPINPNEYYRQVTRPAIDDANTFGIIRSNPNSIALADQRPITYSGASFTKGRLYNPSDKVSDAVIVGGNNIEWVRKFGHEPPSEFNLPYKRTLQVEHGDEVTPIFRNMLDFAPSENFYYWQKGKGLFGKHFWIKKNFIPEDTRYFNAIDLNNYDLLLWLRDYHFLKNSGTVLIDDTGKRPLQLYHGSPNKNITVFRHVPPRTGGRGTGEEGFYSTPLYGYADRYRAKHLMYNPNPAPSEGKVYNLYANIANLGNFSNMPNMPITAFYHMNKSDRALFESLGYDGLLLGNLLNGSKRPEIVVFEPSQYKLSDPITYDDFGNIIPLTSRDDFFSPDLRYNNGGKIIKNDIANENTRRT